MQVYNSPQMADHAHLTCRFCGQEHQSVSLRPGEKARCVRCDALLAVRPRSQRDPTLGFALAGLIFLIPAIVMPFVSAEEFGDRRMAQLLTGVEALWDGGMPFLSILVLLTGTVFPAVVLLSLIPLHLPGCSAASARAGTLAGIAKILFNWSFPEVQVLAVLVGVVKLNSLVALTLGPGFWCYCGMAVSLLCARFGYNSHLYPRQASTLGSLGEDQGGRSRFLVLGSTNRSTSAALALAGIFLLFPANYFPVLTTQSSGDNRTDTIFSGALGLGQQGMWGLAAIVFTASILIPALKLGGLACLLWGAHHPHPERGRRLSRIYAALELIGRYSMLDVFLAAFLVGLVQFGGFATIQARGGLIAFAAVVILTVAATAAFDPTEIWAPRRPLLSS
jgi:paraquat-inducible protein A